MEEEKVALFDMDNSLFDYEGRLVSDLKTLMAPGEVMPDDLWDESLPHIKARMDLIKNQPGWWRNLPKLQLGWDVYDIAVDIGFDIEILTKGSHNRPSSWMEKVQCVEHHFGNKASIVVVSKTKKRHYGRVLVDDYPPYVTDWLRHRPRGLAIMPAHKYNVDFRSPNCIRYDGSNLIRLRRALKGAFDREAGQHWDTLMS